MLFRQVPRGAAEEEVEVAAREQARVQWQPAYCWHWKQALCLPWVRQPAQEPAEVRLQAADSQQSHSQALQRVAGLPAAAGLRICCIQKRAALSRAMSLSGEAVYGS